jgi:hypothetical protein
MAKAITLREEIKAALPSRSRRKWEDDIDPSVLAELEELRSDWAAGKLGVGVTKSGLAKAIVKTLANRGTPASAITVSRWLDR